MQSTASSIVLCLICAVVGAAVVLLLDVGDADHAEPASHAAVAEAVAELSRQVAALERSIEALRPPASLAGAPRPPVTSEDEERAPTDRDPPRPALRVPTTPEQTPSSDLLVTRDVDAPPVPPTNREHVDTFGSWANDPELRARWLLATEASVLEWFGAPDRIFWMDGAEHWDYRRVLRGARQTVRVSMLRGRVVRMTP